jgi:hypothetical protein
MGWLFGDDCVCGCGGAEAHMSDAGTPGGGPCSGCWHCDYYDTGYYLSPDEGRTEGEREYLENLPHRFW